MQKKELLFKIATGKMKYTLTNDYLFRATWQKCKNALKQLICSLLGLEHEDIISIEIMNPIELGKSIEAKDFILDIRVLLNNNTIINLEMQVLNLGNWPERSLTYLCRSFDKLNSGDNYVDVKSVIQVCFLDFTLFKEYSEFFSTYMFTNIKNHIIYSDKLKLYVIDLTCIDKATEEDKIRGIHHWAKLFKATTWEEIKMLTADNTFLEEAAETVFQLSAEEQIRMQCEAREDYYRQQRYIQQKLERLAELESKEHQMLHNVAKLEKEMLCLSESNVALQKDNQTLQEDNHVLQEDNHALQKDNHALQKDNHALQKDNHALQKDNHALQKDNHALQKDNHALQKDNHALQEENQNLLESNKEKDAEIARLKMMLANNHTQKESL